MKARIARFSFRIVVVLGSITWINGLSVVAESRTQNQSSQVGANTVEARVGRGYELMKDERYREAADEFRVALALDSRLVRVRYQLAVCWFAIAKLNEAREEFNRLQRETKNDPNVAYYLGRLDLMEGNLDSAIERFTGIAADPPFPDTAYYLGSAYLKKGELEKVEKWLLEAARANPRDFRVPDHLARVYQREGRKEEAEKQYALSAALRQHYDEASKVAVTCSRLLETRPMEEARRICQELFDPNDPDKLTTLGMLYGQHAYFSEAVEPLRRAASLDPDSFEIQHDLGLTCFRLHRYPEALAALTEAVALRPDFFGSNALLGATLYALGEDEASYRVLFHAHELNPQDADTADLLFKAALSLAGKEFDKHEYAASAIHLETAVRLRPQDVEVRRRLEEVYRLLGFPTKSREERPKP